MNKRSLGRGLDSLLGANKTSATNTLSGERFPLTKLVAGKFQPRRRFAKSELATLADSIRQHGVLQPLVLRPLADGNRYEIIAGERRFRAAQLAGLKTVPAVVRQLSDQEAQICALVENLQREDLNPIEQAQGIALLVEQTQCTHAVAAEYVGLSRPAVSNLLRLLELSTVVQKELINGVLSMGQARALLALAKAKQEAAAAEIILRQLNTRQTEKLVRQLLASKGNSNSRKKSKEADTLRLEKELAEKLSMRVDINHQKSGGGKVVLHYGSLKSLDVVLKKLKH